jgi:hypothetical protein
MQFFIWLTSFEWIGRKGFYLRIGFVYYLRGLHDTLIEFIYYILHSFDSKLPLTAIYKFT